LHCSSFSGHTKEHIFQSTAHVEKPLQLNVTLGSQAQKELPLYRNNLLDNALANVSVHAASMCMTAVLFANSCF